MFEKEEIALSAFTLLPTLIEFCIHAGAEIAFDNSSFPVATTTDILLITAAFILSEKLFLLQHLV